MAEIEVNFNDGAFMCEKLDCDFLSKDTKAIRVRGPRGYTYAYPSLGAWKEIGAKQLRARKEMGVA